MQPSMSKNQLKLYIFTKESDNKMLSWKKSNLKKVIKEYKEVFNFFEVVNINQIWT